MQQVKGIGGVFLKARDKATLAAWYRDCLGVPVDMAWGGAVFPWAPNDPRGDAVTVWSLFAADSDYFGPAANRYMLNFRVDDLDAMLAQLRGMGCAVEDRVEASEFGRFGWVVDPEGNKVELWQPPIAAPSAGSQA